MFFKLLFLLLAINNHFIRACKPEWDNTCRSNSECCSGYCDNNNGQWAFGVCKTGNTPSTQCKPLWDNSCKKNVECCSGHCDNNNGQWAFGVCKDSINPVTNPVTTNPGTTNYLITQSEFEKALVANGYPQPTSIQYQNLVSQAGTKGSIYSKLELGMFLAQIMWESDGLRAKREYYCYPTFNSGCEYSSGIGFSGVHYFGRGYIQLSWDYNYKAASSSLYGSDTLLRNPDQVASNDEISWATAFWFWKTNVIGGPYGQGVRNGQFGSSTNAINGGLECRGANSDKARKRFEIYKKVLLAFNINTAPNETGCYN